MNGAQRLWVLIALLYGSIVTVVTWVSWPPPSDIHSYTITGSEDGAVKSFDVLWGGREEPGFWVAGAISLANEIPSGPPRYVDSNGEAKELFTIADVGGTEIYFPSQTPLFLWILKSSAT